MSLLLIFAVWNVFVFAVYGTDKLFAKRGVRRISERCLLWLAFFMGGTGALFAMSLFRHKTRKTKFRILVPLAVIINALTAVLYLMRG